MLNFYFIFTCIIYFVTKNIQNIINWGLIDECGISWMCRFTWSDLYLDEKNLTNVCAKNISLKIKQKCLQIWSYQKVGTISKGNWIYIVKEMFKKNIFSQMQECGRLRAALPSVKIYFLEHLFNWQIKLEFYYSKGKWKKMNNWTYNHISAIFFSISRICTSN